MIGWVTISYFADVDEIIMIYGRSANLVNFNMRENGYNFLQIVD